MTVMGKGQRCFSPSENLPHLRSWGPSPAPAGQPVPVPAPARLPGAHSPRPPRLEPRPAARRCDPRAAPSVSTAHPGARPAPTASLPGPPPSPRVPHVAAGTSARVTSPSPTQSAPAGRLRSAAPSNRRPRGALVPPPPSRTRALRLKGREGQLPPAEGASSLVGDMSASCLGPRRRVPPPEESFSPAP